MAEWIKALVLRIARLPAEPHVPDGSAESTRVFRAGRNYLRWSIIVWAGAHAGILLSAIAFGIAFETVILRFPPWAQTGTRLLEWIAAAPRPYAEVMDAWRTSCPRLPVWEDAVDARFVVRLRDDGGGTMVAVTDAGRAFLDAERKPASR